MLAALAFAIAPLRAAITEAITAMADLIAGICSGRSADYADARCNKAFTPVLDSDTATDAASQSKGAALNTAATGVGRRTNVFCSCMSPGWNGSRSRIDPRRVLLHGGFKFLREPATLA